MALSPLSIADLSSQVVIGIDPGATGGIAWIDGNGMNVVKMPEEREACRYLYHLVDTFHAYSPRIYVERVFIKAGQAAMVNYVSRYGTMIGAVFAHNSLTTQIYEVTPADWQADYPELATKLEAAKGKRPRAEALAARKERRTEIKDLSRELAGNLYPYLAPLLKKKNTDGMADAILICLHGAHQILKNGV